MTFDALPDGASIVLESLTADLTIAGAGPHAGDLTIETFTSDEGEYVIEIGGSITGDLKLGKPG